MRIYGNGIDKYCEYGMSVSGMKIKAWPWSKDGPLNDMQTLVSLLDSRPSLKTPMIRNMRLAKLLTRKHHSLED